MRKSPTSVVSVLLTSVCVLAQNGSPDYTQRTTIQLVEVNIIADDKQHQPVTNLKASDLELTDNGRRQQIRHFRLNAVSRPGVGIPPAPQAEKIFSNTLANNDLPVTAILIDSINTKWTDQVQSRQQLVGFLRQITSEDKVALYSIGSSGLTVLHDFATPASTLLERLASPAKRPASDRDNDIGRSLNLWLNGQDTSYRSSQLRGDTSLQATKATLLVLETIANRLQSIRGRKNLIWISSGFPLVEWGSFAEIIGSGQLANGPELERPPTAHHEDMLRAMHALNLADVAVYPVDASGLGGTRGTYTNDRVAAYLSKLQLDASQQMMDQVARKTGGRAFYNTNDIAGAMRAVSAASKITYTVAYYPYSSGHDGRTHAIKIKVLNHPGVRLRYRTEYVDPIEDLRVATHRGSELERSSKSPIEATGIQIRAIYHQTAGKVEINAELQAASPVGITGPLDCVIIVYNGQGDELARHTDTTSWAQSPVRLNRTLEIPTNATSLKIVARDPGSGYVGSLRLNLP